MHEISSLPETLTVVNIDDDTGIEKLAWSEDGQLLAATTTYGSVLIYLSKLPMLASAYLNYICVLTSLSQITIYSYSSNKVRNRNLNCKLAEITQLKRTMKIMLLVELFSKKNITVLMKFEKYI